MATHLVTIFVPIGMGQGSGASSHTLDQVPGFQEPGSRFHVPIPGTRSQVPSTSYYQAPGTRYQVLVPGTRPRSSPDSFTFFLGPGLPRAILVRTLRTES